MLADSEERAQLQIKVTDPVARTKQKPRAPKSAGASRATARAQVAPAARGAVGSSMASAQRREHDDAVELAKETRRRKEAKRAAAGRKRQREEVAQAAAAREKLGLEAPCKASATEGRAADGPGSEKKRQFQAQINAKWPSLGLIILHGINVGNIQGEIFSPWGFINLGSEICQAADGDRLDLDVDIRLQCNRLLRLNRTAQWYDAPDDEVDAGAWEMSYKERADVDSDSDSGDDGASSYIGWHDKPANFREQWKDLTILGGRALLNVGAQLRKEIQEQRTLSEDMELEISMLRPARWAPTGWRQIVLNFRTGEFFPGTYCRFYDF
eukprot:SAG11_NODE_4201_length_2017_cov_1.398332_1_plen_326_part_00